MANNHPLMKMKKLMLLLVIFQFLVSCNTKTDHVKKEGALNKDELQGAWYTQSLKVDDLIIDTHEHPECLSAFVFKDDKVKFIQLSDKSEKAGYYKISSDTIYIHDLVTDQCVMTIKVNDLSEKKLDLNVLDGQVVRMILARFNNNKEVE